MSGGVRPGPKDLDAHTTALRAVLRADDAGAPDVDPYGAEQAVVDLLAAVTDPDDLRRVAAALAWTVTAVSAAAGYGAGLRPIAERLLIEVIYCGSGT